MRVSSLRVPLSIGTDLICITCSSGLVRKWGAGIIVEVADGEGDVTVGGVSEVVIEVR